MADDSGQPKAGSKTAENTLNLISTIAGLAGNVILGPDSAGMDFGAPFRMGAQMLKSQRDKNDLISLLSGNPHTAPLVDHGIALHNAGGLANNPDIASHPDVLSMFGAKPVGANLAPSNPDPSLMAPAAPAPSQAPASTPAPSAPSASDPSNIMGLFGSTPGSGHLDPTSDAFLQKAAVLRPDIAEKIVLDRAAQKPVSPMDSLMKMIGLKKDINELNNYETPEQKRLAEQKNKIDLTNLINGNVTQRGVEAKKDTNSKMSDVDGRSIDSLDQALTHVQALPEKISSLMPLGAKLASASPALASYAMPDLSRIQEGLQAAKIQFGSALKGARINPHTIETLSASFPDPSKNPDLWPQMKGQVVARMQLAKLVTMSNLAQRGKTQEGIAAEHGGTPVMDPAQKLDFDVWMKTFEKHGQQALKSPQFQALTKEFGLENLFINPETPVQ